MKRVVDRHALKVATGEKMKKQQHVYDLTASSSVPSAASASQRWRGVMRRVIIKGMFEEFYYLFMNLGR